jgi:hypothetical protein
MKVRKGFSLVSLIFEITVLTVIVLAVVILLGEITITVVESETNTQATDLCISLAEDVFWNYDFDSIPTGSGTFVDYPAYAYSITENFVTEADLDTVTGSSEYKRVRVTVSHADIPDVEVTLLITDI